MYQFNHFGIPKVPPSAPPWTRRLEVALPNIAECASVVVIMRRAEELPTFFPGGRRAILAAGEATDVVVPVWV